MKIIAISHQSIEHGTGFEPNVVAHEVAPGETVEAFVKRVLFTRFESVPYGSKAQGAPMYDHSGSIVLRLEKAAPKPEASPS